MTLSLALSGFSTGMLLGLVLAQEWNNPSLPIVALAAAAVLLNLVSMTMIAVLYVRSKRGETRLCT